MKIIHKHHTLIDIQTHWLDKLLLIQNTVSITELTWAQFVDWVEEIIAPPDFVGVAFSEASLPLFLDRSPKGTVVRLALFRLDLNLVSYSFEFKFVITSGQSHHFFGIVWSRNTVTTVWNAILVRECVTFCSSGRDLYLAGNLLFVVERVTVTQVVVGNEFVVMRNVCCQKRRHFIVVYTPSCHFDTGCRVIVFKWMSTNVKYTSKHGLCWLPLFTQWTVDVLKEAYYLLIIPVSLLSGSDTELDWKRWWISGYIYSRPHQYCMRRETPSWLLYM